MVPVDREADLLEGQEPSLDARADGIDERAIKVEDETIKVGQVSGVGHRGRVVAAGWLIRASAWDERHDGKGYTVAHSIIHQVFLVVALGFVLASPLIGILLQRRSLLGPQGSMVGLDRWLVLPLATLSLGAGLIHAAVVTDHFAESTLSGLFFVVVAVFQVLWAVMFARQPLVRLATLGLMVNGMVVGAWLVTRTVGLPFGAHPGAAEPMAVVDLLATLFEVLIVAGTAALVLPALRGLAKRSRFLVASADLTVVMALILITMVTSYAMADISVNGGHGAETSQADAPR